MNPNRVIEAMNELFGDRTFTPAECKEQLEEAISHAKLLIEALEADMGE